MSTKSGRTPTNIQGGNVGPPPSYYAGSASMNSPMIGNSSGTRIYGGQPPLATPQQKQPQPPQHQQTLQPLQQSVYLSNNIYGSASTSTLATNASAAAAAASVAASRRLTVGDLGPMTSTASSTSAAAYQSRKNVSSMYMTGSSGSSMLSPGGNVNHNHGTIGVANGAGYLRQMESQQMTVDDMSYRGLRR